MISLIFDSHLVLFISNQHTQCLIEQRSDEREKLNHTNMDIKEIRSYIEMKFYTKDRVIEYCIEEIVEKIKQDNNQVKNLLQNK
jgi:hypothetical protein